MIARTRALPLALLTSLVAALLLVALPAEAAGSVVGAFEVDGNLSDDSGAGDPLDWDTLPTGSVILFNDASGDTDDSFKSSKEEQPEGWVLTTGAVPQKNDILEGRIAQREVAGEDWLYLQSKRKFASGSAFLSYEFNASDATFDNDANPATEAVPVRTPGDLLVFITIENGGTSTKIDVFEWDGNHLRGVWRAPAINPIPVRGTDWEAATQPDSTGRFLISEVALNLPAFGQEPGCPGLGKAWIKTISSAQFKTAELKDRTARKDVNITDCGALTINKVDDSTPPQAVSGALFEAILDNGDGVYSAADTTVGGTCITGEEGIAGRCTIEELAPGTYWVREAAAPAGYDPDPLVRGPAVVVVGQTTTLTDAFVNHKLLPDSSLAKAVRNVSADGVFDDADPAAAEAGPGDLLEYRFVYSNSGDGIASDVTISDEVPAWTSFTACTGPTGVVGDCTVAGTGAAGDLVSFGLGDIAAGDTATVYLRVTLADAFNATTVSVPNVGTVSTTEEGNTDSNPALVTVTAAPDFDVDKSVSDDSVSFGDAVTYTITVTNTGSAPGSTPVEDDYDETRMSVASISDGGIAAAGKINWNVEDLAAGQSRSLTYVATFDLPLSGNPGEGCEGDDQFAVHNTVSASGATDSQLVCVFAQPDLDVIKDASATDVALGDVVTYTVKVVNGGNAPGSTQAVDDYDQAHLQILTTGGGTDDGDTLTFDVTNLPAGGEQLFTYTARVIGTFTSDSQTGQCADGRFAVANSVSLTNGASDSWELCAIAPPQFDATKSADPTTAQVGDAVTYTITVTNIGAGPGSTPVDDDFDEAHLNITDAGGGSIAGGVISWSSGTLNPGQTATFTYAGTITGPFSGPTETLGCTDGRYAVPNEVTVLGDQAQATVCVTALPDFDVDKDASEDQVPFGSEITYTVTLTNNGHAEGTTPVEDDYDESALTILSSDPAAVDADGKLTWQSGLLAPGETQTFTYTARFDKPFTGQPDGSCEGANLFAVANLVTVEGDEAAKTVCVLAEPRFDVTKTPSAEQANVGDAIGYTVTVTNTGSAPGETPVEDDYDQAHLQITDAGGGTDDGDKITWPSGSLAPNASATFTYAGTFTGPFTGPAAETCETANQFAVLNQVTVTGDTAQADVCVTALPAYTVDKSSSVDTAEVGETLTYTVTVGNTGDGPGSTPAVDDFDETHLDISAISHGGAVNGGVIEWASVGPIDPGQTIQLTYNATVKGVFADGRGTGGCEGTFPVLNLVTVGDAQADDLLCVNAQPSSVLDKAVRNVTDEGEFADTAEGDAPDQLEYRLSYTNAGTATATAVTIEDEVPAHTTFLSCEPTLDCTLSGGTVTWPIGDVPAGETVVVTMLVEMRDDIASGITLIKNVATASSSEEGEIPSDEVTVSTAAITKDVCPVEKVVPGGALEYRIPISANGGDVSGVIVKDQLPSGFRFGSATHSPASAPNPGGSGEIVWELGTMTDGQALELVVTGTVDAATASGTTLINVASVQADGVAPRTTETSVLVVSQAARDAYATGVELTANGETVRKAKPDSRDGDNLPYIGYELLSTELGDVIEATAMRVDHELSEGGSPSATATATASSVRLLDQDPGVGQDWLIEATGLRAKSHSSASSATASSTDDGSLIEELRIGDEVYHSVDDAQTFVVNDPAAGTTTTIEVLEQDADGAAAGKPQPAEGLFSSALTVTGLRVTVEGPLVPGAERGKLLEVVVGTAHSEASHGSGLACEAADPAVAGSGAALQASVPVVEGAGSAGRTAVSQVRLPSTGGSDSSEVSSLPPLELGDGLLARSGTAGAKTEGTLSGDDAPDVKTEAWIERLELMESDVETMLLSADVLEATAEATNGALAGGSTTITDLRIGEHEPICPDGCTRTDPKIIEPVPGVKITLHEVIDGTHEGVPTRTVNALHLVVDGPNELGLAPGLDLIVASATAGATNDAPGLRAVGKPRSSAPVAERADAPPAPPVPADAPTRELPASEPAVQGPARVEDEEGQKRPTLDLPL